MNKKFSINDIHIIIVAYDTRSYHPKKKYEEEKIQTPRQYTNQKFIRNYSRRASTALINWSKKKQKFILI